MFPELKSKTIMETRVEDPMDLGGFLENYVLSNPFSQRTLSPKSKLNQGGDDTSFGNPITGSVITEGNSSTMSSPGTSEDVGSQTDGTKCGHVGSNRSFAESLKGQKVSNAQKPLQEWLLSQYQCDVTSPALLSAVDLLKKVKQYFPLVTSVILSRTMCFTFPDCRKVINKQGTFWQGLLDSQDADSSVPPTSTCSPAMNGKNRTKTVKELIRSRLRFREMHTDIKLEDSNIGTDNSGRASEFKISTKKLLKRKRKRSQPRRRSKSRFGVPNPSSELPIKSQLGDFNGLEEEGLCLSREINATNQELACFGPQSNELLERTEQGITSEQYTAGRDLSEDHPYLPVPVSEIKKELGQMIESDRNGCQESFSSGQLDCDTSCNDHTTETNISSAFHKNCCEMQLQENKKLLQKCSDLEHTLDSSQSQVNSLQVQLQTRDVDLAELADDFFELSQSFHRLSQRFQRVLKGSVVTQEENRSSDNHMEGKAKSDNSLNYKPPVSKIKIKL